MFSQRCKKKCVKARISKQFGALTSFSRVDSFVFEECNQGKWKYNYIFKYILFYKIWFYRFILWKRTIHMGNSQLTILRHTPTPFKCHVILISSEGTHLSKTKPTDQNWGCFEKSWGWAKFNRFKKCPKGGNF